MSASLVGSEMCIRDRPPRATRELRLRRRCVALPGSRPASGPPWRVPVSYTHLTLPTICSV
eukprot:986706-Alexandrium_andersonii.AAC.1